MSPLALALVLGSAVAHAGWNFLAKRAGGDMTFVWLFSTLATVIYLPLALLVLAAERPTLGLREIAFLGGTVFLHILYYFLLERGYRAGDMSLVYPLARGTGPLLSIVGAVLLLGERPSAAIIVGALLVAAGVVILTGNPLALRGHKAAPAVVYGLLTGLSIAAYTLWDKQAVSALLIPPVFLTWVGNAAQAVILAPHALRQHERLRHFWTEHRREAIGISILDSLSYMLFLIALAFSPVSYLAPMRQVSILIGAFLGVRLLSEAAAQRRLAAAGVMLVGLAALAFG